MEKNKQNVNIMKAYRDKKLIIMFSLEKNRFIQKNHKEKVRVITASSIRNTLVELFVQLG